MAARANTELRAAVRAIVTSDMGGIGSLTRNVVRMELIRFRIEGFKTQTEYSQSELSEYV